jgi:hypothetical protein
MGGFNLRVGMIGPTRMHGLTYTTYDFQTALLGESGQVIVVVRSLSDENHRYVETTIQLYIYVAGFHDVAITCFTPCACENTLKFVCRFLHT